MKKISQILKDTRHDLNLTLETISKATKIPLELLVQIEEGQWTRLGSYAYLQGIVKKYASFLKLDEEKALSYLKRDYKLENPRFIRVSDYEEKPKLNINWYFYLILALIVVFFLIQFFLAWQKPLLKLSSIPKSVKVTSPLVIKGKTQSGVLLYLNDQQIYADEKGNFREELYFERTGERQIEIKAIGVNGKEEVKNFQVKVQK